MNKKEEAIKRLRYIRAEYEEPLELNSREDIRRGIQVYIDAIDMAIEAMQNERPKGHWVEVYDIDYLSYLYSCDQCGEPAPTKRETMCDQILTGYCPNCGARMVGGKE